MPRHLTYFGASVLVRENKGKSLHFLGKEIHFLGKPIHFFCFGKKEIFLETLNLQCITAINVCGAIFAE